MYTITLILFMRGHIKKAKKILRDKFIPHEGNNHQPHVLEHRALLIYSAFLIGLKVLAIILPIALPSSSLYSSSVTPENIIALTNQTRENLGLSKLKFNAQLAQAAQAKAEDMAANQYFAHVSPAGTTPWDWFVKAGYKYLYAGENLAVHYISAEGLQEGWLASPTHRANIVHPKYREIGIGVANGEFEGMQTTFVVEMFGLPASAAVQPASVSDVEKTLPKVITEPKVAAAKSTPIKQALVVKSPPKVAVVNPLPAAQNAPTASTTNKGVTPVIYESSLKIIPQGTDSYLVKLTITNATNVVLNYASRTVPLIQNGEGSVWQGVIPIAQAESGGRGDSLSVLAWGTSATPVSRSLALLAPATQTQQLYVFNEGADKYAKFFGFLKVHNLNDSVSRFYLYFVVILGAALMLNVFIKIRIQHPKIISHALSVMALALLLFII